MTRAGAHLDARAQLACVYANGAPMACDRSGQDERRIEPLHLTVRYPKTLLAAAPFYLRSHPPVGPNAYTVEEVWWCDANIELLKGQLDDEGRAKRLLPTDSHRASWLGSRRCQQCQVGRRRRSRTCRSSSRSPQGQPELQ